MTIGSITLLDRFEWDINCRSEDPERFADVLCTELGLGGEFKYDMYPLFVFSVFVSVFPSSHFTILQNSCRPFNTGAASHTYKIIIDS